MNSASNQPKSVSHITVFEQIPQIKAVPHRRVKWLVEGLIPRRSITLITAPPGNQKTWFALALSGAVSTGLTFLGRPTKRTPVLYMDRDNPLAVVSERRRMLGLSGKRLRFWGSWLSDPPPSIDDERLLEFARQHQPLFVFDFFRRFHTADENSAKETGIVMAGLRELVNAGATVVLLHHGSKSGQSVYRGSTDIHAGVDVALALAVERKTGRQVLKLNCFKHRFTQEFDLTLALNLEGGKYDVISDNSEDRGFKKIRILKNLITKKPGRSQKVLITLSGMPEHSVRRVLQANVGTHWRTERGKGKTLRYYPI